MRRQPWAPRSSSWVRSGWAPAAWGCSPSGFWAASRRPLRACVEEMAADRTDRARSASSGSGSARSASRGRVSVVSGLAERAALDALLERAPEPQGPPVLAAQPPADLVLGQLALLLEEVLDQRELAPQPPFVLVLVLRRSSRERGIGRGRHRAPPVGRVVV